MSHFVTLVVTNDDSEEALKNALQPYHEYECTGIEDEYVKFVPVNMTEAKAQYEKDLKGEPSTGAKFQAFMKDWYGAEMGEDENGNRVWGTKTNPNRKWDWWVVGGRWSGFLTDKNGERVDHGRIEDLDFTTPLTKAKAAAKAQWDKAQKILAGRTFQSFAAIRADVADIDAAREIYKTQPPLVDLRELLFDDKTSAFFFNFDVFSKGVAEERFIKDAAGNVITPFAFLKDGVWHEKGDMGWWGMVADEKQAADWQGEFAEMLCSLPKGSYLWAVDCHI